MKLQQWKSSVNETEMRLAPSNLINKDCFTQTIALHRVGYYQTNTRKKKTLSNYLLGSVENSFILVPLIRPIKDTIKWVSPKPRSIWKEELSTQSSFHFCSLPQDVIWMSFFWPFVIWMLRKWTEVCTHTHNAVGRELWSPFSILLTIMLSTTSKEMTYTLSCNSFYCINWQWLSWNRVGLGGCHSLI